MYFCVAFINLDTPQQRFHSSVSNYQHQIKVVKLSKGEILTQFGIEVI